MQHDTVMDTVHNIGLGAYSTSIVAEETTLAQMPKITRVQGGKDRLQSYMNWIKGN